MNIKKNLFQLLIKSKGVFLSLAFILFSLTNCSCGCEKVGGDASTNYSTYNASVVVFGDGCGNYEGSTSNASDPQEPNAKCDDYDGGSYKNRGRWVKVPDFSVKEGSELKITTYGSVYYCSWGYDNRNPSPRAEVKTAYPRQTFFKYDEEAYNLNNQPVPVDTEIPVQPGQLIILDIEDPNNIKGLALGPNPTEVLDVCLDTEYDKFVAGQCRVIEGHGLTVYVDNTEVATLDYKDAEDGTYQNKKYRYPHLYKPFVPDDDLDKFYTGVEDVYGVEGMSSTGPRKYVFMVPENLKGTIGFSIAQEAGILDDGSAGSGTGQYNVMVRSAPQSCMIQNSKVSDSGLRGALELLIEPSGVNPNQYDTVIDDFESETSVSEYYPELTQFLAGKIGVTITSNAEALGDLVVFSDYESEMTVIKDQVFEGQSNEDGYIWLRVRDDYYHDNLGHYDVYVEARTKNSTLVSDFLASLTDPIIESLNKTTQVIYSNFANSYNFLNIMKMCMMLYIMIFGAQFILGLGNITARDAVARAVKLGVVTILFEPDSWDFFNTYFFKLFTDGKDYLITTVTGDTSTDRSGVFGFIDDVFYVFFAQITWEKFAAMLPYLIGVVYIALFIQVMLVYLVVATQVLMVYLLTIMGISLLLSLAPMFMITMLFERTRNIFTNWVKHLADYALQPVILFAVFYVVNEIFMTFWNNAMDFEICYGGIWNLDFFGIFEWTKGVIPSFTIGCIHYYDIKGGLKVYEMFIEIMMLLFFVYITKAVIAHVPTLTESLTGASGSASAISGVGTGLIQAGVDVASGGNEVERYERRKGLENKEAKEKQDNEDIKEARDNRKKFIKDTLESPLNKRKEKDK